MSLNHDLALERLSCPFDKEEVTHLLDGGPDKTQQRRKIQDKFIQSMVGIPSTKK